MSILRNDPCRLTYYSHVINSMSHVDFKIFRGTRPYFCVVQYFAYFIIFIQKHVATGGGINISEDIQLQLPGAQEFDGTKVPFEAQHAKV